MKTTTEMRLVPITKLVPYVNNARTHSPGQINKLRSSLREFGFINPVIIDRDYGVIAGHRRIAAAKEEGISEVPCVFADHLTEAQKKTCIGSILVSWDSGGSLNIVYGEDECRIVKP